MKNKGIQFGYQDNNSGKFLPKWTILQKIKIKKKKKRKRNLKTLFKDLTTLHWSSHAFQINV